MPQSAQRADAFIISQNDVTLPEGVPANVEDLPVKKYRLEKDVDVFALQQTVEQLSADVSTLQQQVKDLKSSMTNGIAFAGLALAVLIFLLFRKAE